MKHHNLYRLCLIGYGVGGLFLSIMFASAMVGILTGSNAAEGFAWFYGILGTLATAGGATAHVFAYDKGGDLKPLPKEQRASIERQARERRADRELALTIEMDERRTRAIEGKTVECEESGWDHYGDLSFVNGRFVCSNHNR